MFKPIKLIIRGEVPALKNERIIGHTKEGKPYSAPSKEVEKRISQLKDSFRRQLPDDFQMILEPQEVFIMAEIGYYYLSALPKADLDNSWTTVQESLFTVRHEITKALAGPVIQDDRQVASFWPIRRKFQTSKDLAYSLVTIFPYTDGIYEIHKSTLLTINEMYANILTNV